MPDLIDTTTMPGDNMSPELIEAAATNLGSVGTKVSTRGGTVLTRWQTISAVYDAPEETTLTQAMNPVKTKAEAFGTDMAAAAKALNTFADQVRIIKAEVAKIRADAASFLGGITDGKVETTYYGGGDYYSEPVAWHTDQDTVDANNALKRRIDDQQEALWAAERACASAIRAAIGLGPIHAASAANPDGYGVTDIPADAPMPWGSTVERTESCLERAGDGLVDAGGAALSGLGNIVGISYTDDQGLDWSLSTFGDAWKGIVMFGVGALTLGAGGLVVSHAAPGPVGKFLRDSQFMVPATVAGLVAIDLYAKDPLHKWKLDAAHAGGATLFSLATLPLAALKVSNVAKLGRLGRATPDGPDVTPSTRNVPDGTGSVRGVDVSDVTGLTQKADLDGSLSIKTDLDINVGKADGDGPPTGRTDGDGPATDRTDSDTRGQDTTPDDGRPDSDPADPDPTDGDSRPADQPVIGSGTGTPDDKRVYGYRNRAESLRGVPEPDQSVLDGIGTPKQYDPGTLEHLQSRWLAHLETAAHEHKTPKTWESYRKGYIANLGNDPKGKAFELAYRTHQGYEEAAGYKFNTLAPDTKGFKRNYDIIHVKNSEAIELKSGKDIDPDQLAKDAFMVGDGWTVRYVFGTPPTAATLARLARLGIEVDIFHSVAVVTE